MKRLFTLLLALGLAFSVSAVWAQTTLVYGTTEKVTGLINAIADCADKVNDRPSKVFIQWFVSEQVEEEKNASRILDLLKKIPPNSAGIFQLDHQLAKRA